MLKSICLILLGISISVISFAQPEKADQELQGVGR
jgi:hypothetical protein